MSVAEEFVTANEHYAGSFTQGDLALPPSRKVAVVTCMDARIDPLASLGLSLGEAHVIRNAGGRATDALRSLVISQHLLGTREVVLFHHTDCGMLTFSDEELRKRLGGARAEADAVAFLPFGDLDQSVRDDVKFLTGHPLLVEGSGVSGWVYDVVTGKMRRVA